MKPTKRKKAKKGETAQVEKTVDDTTAGEKPAKGKKAKKEKTAQVEKPADDTPAGEKPAKGKKTKKGETAQVEKPADDTPAGEKPAKGKKAKKGKMAQVEKPADDTPAGEKPVEKPAKGKKDGKGIFGLSLFSNNSVSLTGLSLLSVLSTANSDAKTGDNTNAKPGKSKRKQRKLPTHFLSVPVRTQPVTERTHRPPQIDFRPPPPFPFTINNMNLCLLPRF